MSVDDKLDKRWWKEQDKRIHTENCLRLKIILLFIFTMTIVFFYGCYAGLKESSNKTINLMQYTLEIKSDIDGQRLLYVARKYIDYCPITFYTGQKQNRGSFNPIEIVSRCEQYPIKDKSSKNLRMHIIIYFKLFFKIFKNVYNYMI